MILPASLTTLLHFHHIGLAVADPDVTFRFLALQGYTEGNMVYDPLQRVNLAMRHHQIMPQLDADPLRAGFSERFSKGIAFFVIGCLKKVFLADPMARLVDPIFASAVHAVPSVADAWHGALAFAFQLFLDFSAYSEMAIGIGLMLGVRFPDNF